MHIPKWIQRIVLIPGLLVVLGLFLFAIAVRPSQAATGDLTFTIEAPGVQTSQVSCPSGLVTETFDAFAVGGYKFETTPIGSYQSLGGYNGRWYIADQDVFGGANVPTSQTPRYIRTSAEYVFRPQQPVGYVGFWWSAGDGKNQLSVNMSDGSVQTFTTQTILDSSALVHQAYPTGHFGNPNSNPVTLTQEAFAYVNIFATDPNVKIASLVFSESGGGFFETDNHSTCADILDPSGSMVSQYATLTIKKDADPDSDQSFSFTSQPAWRHNL
ncbi:MAG: hypothetical protein R3C44_15420 [Chloroflexota bacterium]